MELFGFINKKSYCNLFVVLGSVSFLGAIILFLTLVFVLLNKQYNALWLTVLLFTLLYGVVAFENYILYSMCQKLIVK